MNKTKRSNLTLEKVKASATLKMRLQIRIARMMPDWLIYWCAILVGVNATTGKYAKITTADRITMT